MILLALAACASSPVVEEGLPDRAPALVLLATAAAGDVDVDGVVLSDQTVDLDTPEDDRYPFRYSIVDDAGDVVYQRTTTGPVLVRAFLEHYGAEAGVDVLSILPALGQMAFQVPRIDGAEKVRFELRRADGSWESAGSWSFAEAEGMDQGVSEAVIDHATLHGDGTSENRLDIALLGDGYTADQQERWRSDADALAAAILATPPLSDLADYIAIHRVDVISAESGASFDCVGECKVRDTAFGTLFPIEAVNRFLGTDYVGRAMFQADQWEVARAASTVPWDMVVVVSNSKRPAGMAVHFASVTSWGPGWDEAGVHELGHILGLLGDEYDEDDCILSDELGLPENIADDVHALPWAGRVDPWTPLPTPDKKSWEGVVGAFEHAYNCKRLYRPTRSCLMNTGHDFCPVCTELLVRRIFRHVDPADSVTIASDGGLRVEVEGPRQDLEVLVRRPDDGRVLWEGRTGERVRLPASAGRELDVAVRFPTDDVIEGREDLEQRRRVRLER